MGDIKIQLEQDFVRVDWHAIKPSNGDELIWLANGFDTFFTDYIESIVGTDANTI